jgi:hypothetical protein
MDSVATVCHLLLERGDYHNAYLEQMIKRIMVDKQNRKLDILLERFLRIVPVGVL